MAGPSAITGKIAKAAPSKPTKPTPKSTSGLSSKQKAAIAGLGGITESLGALAGLVEKMGAGESAGGLSGNRTDASYIAEGRSGTSNTGQNYINGKLATPEEWQKFLYGDNKGAGADSGADKAATDLLAAQKLADRKSAYDLLAEEFTRYGLGSLVEGIKGLIQENVSPSEFTIRLRQTDAYKRRFAANAQRIAKGLAAVSEADYIGLEDQYQNIMRQYGLPETYYTRGEMGRQEGFEKFIANDISAVELEDRIQTAQNRVINANPEVTRALKEFYPDITNGDILAYTLDPNNAIKNIQRKVTAAEIGGAAMGQGLQTSLARAEELTAAGIDKAAAQQGFETVAQVAPRGGQLAEFYKESPYTQATAEQEVFNLAGSAEAAQKRRKLTALETAAFSGQAGLGALARDRAGVI